MTIESVTQDQVNALIRSIGALGAMTIRLHEVDLARGRGVLKGRDRCLWTKDGKKITISISSDGGVMASCEK